MTRKVVVKMSRKKARKALKTILATIVMLITVFPLYWMIITSFKTTDEVLLNKPTFWAMSFNLNAYRDVLTHYPVFHYLFNTLVATLGIVIIQSLTAILAAYGFSKGSFPGRNILFVFVLGAMMIPIQVTFIPIYVLISRQGLLNSYIGLILPEAASAYSILCCVRASSEYITVIWKPPRWTAWANSAPSSRSWSRCAALP